jgi:hypothetical protein
MGVPVMRVREMPVDVGRRLVSMHMGMPRAGWHWRVVLVVVVQVVGAVHMLVFMLHHLVFMRVLVPLGQVQGHADGHQQACEKQRHRDRLAKQHDGDISARTEEWE